METSIATPQAAETYEHVYRLQRHDRDLYDGDYSTEIEAWDDQKMEFTRTTIGDTRCGEAKIDPALRARLTSKPRIPADVQARIIHAKQPEFIKKIDAAYENAVNRIMNPDPKELGRGVEIEFKRGNSASSKYVFARGQKGTVFWSGHHGKFYRNGYNKPNASNGSVGVKLEDKTDVFAPMTAVRLAEPIPVPPSADYKQAASFVEAVMFLEECTRCALNPEPIDPEIRSQARYLQSKLSELRHPLEEAQLPEEVPSNGPQPT